MLEKSVDVIGVSDVVIGYGSPQINMLFRDISDYYGTRGQLLQPSFFGDDIKFNKQKTDKYFVKTVYIDSGAYSRVGRIDYIIKCADIINKNKPKILIIYCTYSIPVILKLKYKPDKIIYYCLELISCYGKGDVMLNNILQEKIDLLIFPEKNRMLSDVKECHFKDHNRWVNVYNASTYLKDSCSISSEQRNGKFLYAGKLSYATLSDFFWHSGVKKYSIDIYGSIAKDIEYEFLTRVCGENNKTIKYNKFINNSELCALRPQYSFSLILWKGDNLNGYYCAPNKLFESLAYGVPIIATPNPQCIEIIERYQCGIYMKEWTITSFLEALSEAQAMLNTSKYSTMVDNCLDAFKKDLSWDAQFEVIKRHL